MNALRIKTAQGWSDEETFSLAMLYLNMVHLSEEDKLGAAKSRGQVSKAALVKEWIFEVAPMRSKGSVEAKLMNLSAVRVELGLPIVPGYKALPNMAASTRIIGGEVFLSDPF
tara:strand:+ start:542 stop:880 length:339 start_codon:yes stop_codon:yes gene_type:complete